MVLLREDADQWLCSLRALFNSLRHVVCHGILRRAMPNDLPSWTAVYQQAQRWLAAGVFEALASDLHATLRPAAGGKAKLGAAIPDSRTLRSTPESGERRMRWRQAQAGLQAAPGCRHVRPSARPERRSQPTVARST
jgi:transposase